MIIFTPKLGHVIHLQGEVMKLDASFHARAVAEAMERGAREVVENLVGSCATYQEQESFGAKVTRFTISAIVMSEDEFKQELERAYMEGFRRARDSNALTWKASVERATGDA